MKKWCSKISISTTTFSMQRHLLVSGQSRSDKKITRSYKDSASLEYITYVCKIADPSVGKGTILNAMRGRITKTGKHVAEFRVFCRD